MPLVQPSASVAATGLGIRYIGSGEYQHAYAYSGPQDVVNSTKILLDFYVGAGYIVGTFQPQYLDNYGIENYQFKVLFNDIQVAGCVLDKIEGYTPFEEIELIIPPQTHVVVNAINVSDADTRSMAAIITGRVYGAE